MIFANTSTGTRASQKGFTLIELLVVIAIIGLLSSVILASLNTARKKGRDARRIADLKQLQTAVELYNSDNNKYPVGTGSAVAVASALSALAPSYIGTVTDDPSGGSQHYYYIADTNGAFYCLGAKMEGTAPAVSCSNSGYTSALNSATGGSAGTTGYTVGP